MAAHWLGSATSWLETAAMAAAEGAPLTGVGWANGLSAVPPGWTAITATVEGAAAGLGKGFGHKGSGYLCVRTGGAQVAPVVTDVQVLSDRSPQPAGYTHASEFPEPRTAVSRKKRIYVRLQPREAAETAVFDIQLSAKNRALPHYMKIGEIGGFAIWCKKGPVACRGPQPLAEPQMLSTGLQQLSLHTPDSPQQVPAAHGSLKRAPQTGSLYDSTGIYGLSAMDGVPFTLHPRFESRLSPGSTALLADLTVKSLADIEREYHYAFVVERTAAARLPPSVC
ncbi:multivesicular body subunit 12A [Cuculus canorus]|uniref:multivesicular body subunit 12A n=1 Tax=Cuculus canorus TaxID=55661 RepID=UPI0023AA8900|nr:multivesicular body subunit 12A [Cuculus canorus]